ncbi:hypothetical protein AKG95_13685 [Janthinobacterium lividum]|uniref:Uncharacterized protein n=1 Tax=Janthinobacterium lividum TaxID=29581 RepID=A0A1S1U6N8_9BURK|nr:hypothetical protein [Janthinobacterium lividum]OHV95926.1 hypothetical protein AKG95_13685 [Janthinobacterium lividum]
MNKNDIQDLVMGVAFVALGYAMYTQFKPGKTAGGAMGALSPILNGQIGTSYNPMQGAPYDQNTALGSFGLAGLLSGTTNDWTYGGKDYLR